MRIAKNAKSTYTKEMRASRFEKHIPVYQHPRLV